MAEYIDKAAFVGERLTSSEQQLRFREMTGAEAYNEFLRLVNEMPAADVAPVRHGCNADDGPATAEYVERTALRDALYDADAITMNGVKILNQFPAADVAPVVHGRWEHVYQSFRFGEFEDVFRCSACGGETHHEYEFCPVCGAKMGGSGDG